MVENLRAILVCVDYSDILAITLPRMRHHFKEMLVVTTATDLGTVQVCDENGIRWWCTSSFYADRAVFNKWRALEEGLELFGRHGWMCLLDADVIWPKDAKLPDLQVGQLCSPLRRMLVNPIPQSFDDLIRQVDNERGWQFCPIHRNVNEWAGYSQIFHAADPVLGSPPWHDIDWSHAGGADSFFQAKWAKENKVRPDWECLHIGNAGENWFGRTSPRLDGSVPEKRAENLRETDELWRRRAERRRQGLDQFEPERIRPSGTT
jgi:hypothetical protein